MRNMRASCSICTENFTLESEISASPCGHTFHDKCLAKWFKHSKTCPQCRKSVKVDNVIHKLFFSEGDVEDGFEDVGKLKNEIDSLRLDLRQKDKDRTNQETEQEKLRKRITGLQENVNSMQLLYQQERSKTDTLKKELVYLKKMQKEAEMCREEADKLRKKLVTLKNVEDLVNGMVTDMETKVKHTNSNDLAMWCVVQEKELKRKKVDCRKLQEETQSKSKDFSKLKRLYDEKCRKLEIADEKLKMSEEDVNRLERQNKTLKSEIEVLHGGNNKSGMSSRYISESPAPLPPCKRPRLSEPDHDNSIDLNETDILFKSPSSHITPNTKLKNNCKEYGTKFVKITSAATANKASSQNVKDISNLPPQIPGLGNFNILKKSMGTGSMLKQQQQSSVIKKGYNGLGGHENFIQPRGHPFAGKPKVRKTSSTGSLQLPKAVMTNNPPPFPSLDDF